MILEVIYNPNDFVIKNYGNILLRHNGSVCCGSLSEVTEVHVTWDLSSKHLKCDFRMVTSTSVELSASILVQMKTSRTSDIIRKGI